MDKHNLFTSHEINVLIVEDSAICAAALKSALEEIGITNILIAHSGETAIQLFSNPFQIIFMDLNLGNLNGIKLTQIFRKVSPKKDTPIICCSSEIHLSYKECIEAGMDDFLEKPISIKKLKEILACWIVQRI